MFMYKSNYIHLIDSFLKILQLNLSLQFLVPYKQMLQSSSQPQQKTPQSSSSLRRTNSSSRKTDHSLKILLIGNSGVGKSSILMQYSENKFLPNYYTTIGVDYVPLCFNRQQKLKYLDIAGKSVKLQIWDTAGQDRFKTIVSSYYRGAHGILIVYDVSDKSSFEGVSNWLGEIQKLADQNIVKFLVGNKNDLQERRQVSFEEGKMLSDKLKIGFKETSARLATNIEEIFIQMTETILGIKKFVAMTEPKPDKNLHKLINDKKVQKAKDSGCC